MAATDRSRTDEQIATEERIRARAYELYLQRGAADGWELDDWLVAESELNGGSVAEPLPEVV